MEWEEAVQLPTGASENCLGKQLGIFCDLHLDFTCSNSRVPIQVDIDCLRDSPIPNGLIHLDVNRVLDCQIKGVRPDVVKVAFEVISSSQRGGQARRRVQLHCKAYVKAGVGEVLLIDPFEKCFYVYTAADNGRPKRMTERLWKSREVPGLVIHMPSIYDPLDPQARAEGFVLLVGTYFRWQIAAIALFAVTFTTSYFLFPHLIWMVVFVFVLYAVLVLFKFYFPLTDALVGEVNQAINKRGLHVGDHGGSPRSSSRKRRNSVLINQKREND